MRKKHKYLKVIVICRNIIGIYTAHKIIIWINGSLVYSYKKLGLRSIFIQDTWPQWVKSFSSRAFFTDKKATKHWLSAWKNNDTHMNREEILLTDVLMTIYLNQY